MLRNVFIIRFLFCLLNAYKVKTNPKLDDISEFSNQTAIYMKCIKTEKKIKKLSEYRERLDNFISKTEENLKTENYMSNNFTDEISLNFSLPNKDEIFKKFELIESK